MAGGEAHLNGEMVDADYPGGPPGIRHQNVNEVASLARTRNGSDGGADGGHWGFEDVSGGGTYNRFAVGYNEVRGAIVLWWWIRE